MNDDCSENAYICSAIYLQQQSNKIMDKSQAKDSQAGRLVRLSQDGENTQ
jgi:hypothetical protein